MNPNNNEHSVYETKQLFKHLILFLVVTMVLRLWNIIMFGAVPWSRIIIVVWTIILSIHLLLFFLSTGVLGDKYENIPVKVIADRLMDTVNERYVPYRKWISKIKNRNNITPV